MSKRLPPGVSSHHIPGNRPEDVAWDQLVQDATEDLGPALVAHRLDLPDEALHEAMNRATGKGNVDEYEAVSTLIRSWYDEEHNEDHHTYFSYGLDVRARLWPVRGRLRRALEGIGIEVEAMNHGHEPSPEDVRDLLQRLSDDVRGALDHIEEEED